MFHVKRTWGNCSGSARRAFHVKQADGEDCPFHVKRILQNLAFRESRPRGYNPRGVLFEGVDRSTGRANVWQGFCAWRIRKAAWARRLRP
jgi:hypothetical protein